MAETITSINPNEYNQEPRPTIVDTKGIYDQQCAYSPGTELRLMSDETVRVVNFTWEYQWDEWVQRYGAALTYSGAEAEQQLALYGYRKNGDKLDLLPQESNNQ